MNLVKALKSVVTKGRKKKPHYVKLKGGISVKTSTRHISKGSMSSETNCSK